MHPGESIRSSQELEREIFAYDIAKKVFQQLDINNRINAEGVDDESIIDFKLKVVLDTTPTKYLDIEMEGSRLDLSEPQLALRIIDEIEKQNLSPINVVREATAEIGGEGVRFSVVSLK